MLIDTHTHLDFEVFSNGLKDTLEKCLALGVQKAIVPGVTAKSWENIRSLTHSYAGIMYPAYGLHPCFCEKHSNDDLTHLYELCERDKPIAVGEIGLDFFIEDPDHERQMFLFSRQLEIANQFKLPIIVHCRKAHDQCLKAIKDAKLESGGVIHAYSGSLEQAKRYVDLGFKLGIGGGATYDRAKKLHKIIQTLPLTSFVLETDAPDIPPCFARGEPNSPLNLPKIAAIIAQHVDIPLETLIDATTANAKAVFSI